MTYSYSITAEHDGMTVGTFLRRVHSYSSRTLTKLKHYPEGLTLDGVHTRVIDTLLEGQTLTVTFLEPQNESAPSKIAVPILFEDNDLLIYNKPHSMPVHTCCSHAVDTLENVYAAHCRSLGLSGTLRALNRLDRDTSGCVLIAKNRFIASKLTGSFNKAYRAIVLGDVLSDGRIEGRILRPDPIDMRRVVDELGQVAITEYGVIKRSGAASFLQFNLLTGRTHQIRVHMSHIGHPVLGDTLYGEKSPIIGRQALHCHSLSFSHPVSGEAIRVTAPLPEDIQAAYGKLFNE